MADNGFVTRGASRFGIDGDNGNVVLDPDDGKSTDLTTLLTLRPTTEPATPATGEVAVWNDTDAIKAKFDDGTAVTIAEK